MLARLRLDRTVRELLIGEGVLIDPVGAIVAIVAAEYVLGQAVAWEAGWLVVARLGTGLVIGGMAGAFTVFLLHRRWIPDHLRNPVVLALVIFSAAVASRGSSEAGLMSAVTQGVVIGNSHVPELGRMRQFKEERMGSLPSELDWNLRTLDRLNLELSTNLMNQESVAQRISLLSSSMRPGRPWALRSRSIFQSPRTVRPISPRRRRSPPTRTSRDFLLIRVTLSTRSWWVPATSSREPLPLP